MRLKRYPANKHESGGAHFVHSHFLKTTKMAKYNNIKYDGCDSIREYRRLKELELMQKKGLISGLQKQVPFELIPSQRENPNNPKSKVLERSVKYIADFQYLREKDGVLVVEDAKGMRTKEYIIKRKLMLHVHGIRITEV